MKKTQLFFFYTIFFIGVLAGLLLTALAAWADLEAASYGFDRTGDRRLTSLRCPPLMTASETSTFSVKVANTTERALSPSVKTDISTRMVAETSRIPVKLAAGESKRIRWEIGPENIDLERFIFVRAYVSGFYPLPNRENTCGVFILKLPGNGMVITWTLVGMSILGLAAGMLGLERVKGTVQHTVVDMLRIQSISVLVLLGLFTAYMGWWLMGVLVIVFAVLLLVVSLLAFKW